MRNRVEKSRGIIMANMFDIEVLTQFVTQIQWPTKILLKKSIINKFVNNISYKFINNVSNSNEL